MNSEKEADYRRAISVLLSQGYKLKPLKKVVTAMCDEQADAQEEARAFHQRQSRHAYIPSPG